MCKTVIHSLAIKFGMFMRPLIYIVEYKNELNSSVTERDEMIKCGLIDVRRRSDSGRRVRSLVLPIYMCCDLFNGIYLRIYNT